MEIIVEILTLIVCVLLILVVLVQDSKGGGLSSSFGASNQILGVRKTTDFLEKATWFLAIGLLILSLGSAAFIKSGVQTGSENSSSISKQRADTKTVPGPGQEQQQQAPPQTPPANNAPQTAPAPTSNGSTANQHS
jgi:preprotein translocase subunit SecG